MDFMIEQSLWVLKSEIQQKKKSGEAFFEGEYCRFDTDSISPMGFSDRRHPSYDCIEEARRFLPSLLAPRRLFERVEYRARPEWVRHHLLLHHTVEYCTLASRLTMDGKQYLTKLYEAAVAEGISLSMQYYWTYCCGAPGNCYQSEPLSVADGFDVACDFSAPISAPLVEVRDGARLSVILTYRLETEK